MHITQTFINELFQFYMELAVKFNNVMFLWDFNIHVNSPDNEDAIQFFEMCDTVSLQQHTKQETHISGNTMDLGLNECGNCKKICDIQTGLYLPDHSISIIACEYPKKDCNCQESQILKLEKSISGALTEAVEYLSLNLSFQLS